MKPIVLLKVSFKRTIILPVLISALALIAFGQTTTARLTGSVTDATGAAVPEARLTATNVATGIQRTATSGAEGYYTIPLLERGKYEVALQKQGFRPIVREMTLDVGQIARLDFVLEVGEMTEKVTVTAEAAPVQTASAERSGVITGSQIDNLLIRSRSINGFLRLLPGVVDETVVEVFSPAMGMYTAGSRNNTNNVTLDGLLTTSMGSGTNHAAFINQDSVAEVRVLLTNYQAEYGRTSGANIQVVSKSGGREFHGLGSYFFRHEQFNANNFFNNRLGADKPRYRYRTWTYSIGGPIYIPGKFNRNRDKLFFFWSQEYWPIKSSTALHRVTVPTDLERAGDFSQSLEVNNKLIVVTDPATGQPFSGNRIPVSRTDSNGQALLKFFPAPNFFDRTISGGNYNYVFQSDIVSPIRTSTLKLDYNATANDTLSGSLTLASIKNEGSVDVSAAGWGVSASSWPQMRMAFVIPSRPVVVRYGHTFSPSMINELYVGSLKDGSRTDPIEEEVRRNQRDVVGFNAGQLNPGINPLKLIPNATFGGVTSAASLTIGGFPSIDKQNNFNLADNVTKFVGGHTLKAGIYGDLINSHRDGQTSNNGSFSFGRDVNNALDSGYAYSNAILGVFATYTEPSSAFAPHYRMRNVEWFVQDNWKVTPRLTLDYGLRFAEVLPSIERDNHVSGFVLSRYDLSRQVRLIQPRLVGGKRAGVDPVSGEVFPAALIGAIAPGVGDPANGMVVAAKNPTYPRALIDNRGVHFAPRFGFAYDPFGKGRTAMRGGFGMFYNRQDMGDAIGGLIFQTPLVDNPVVYYGTLARLLDSRGLLFPQSVSGVDRAGDVPTVMNFSFSIQQDVGFGTVLDVGYVGSLGRHLMWRRNLNAVPFGTNFLPANADPANPSVPLPSAFLRPLVGYNNISLQEWASSSHYHSLQVTATRRFRAGLQFSANWTWSKAMGFNNSDADSVSTLVPIRVWNYGLASFDRTHMVKVGWVWDTPKIPWANPVAKLVFNDWQVNGIAIFSSGAPLGVGFSTTTGMDITGSPTDGARIVVTGNPVLPKSERTFSRNFRTEVFQLPAKGTIGNAATTLIRGPGINNWDVAVFKNFPIREQMRFQFRCEMYNAFNHTQFSGLDTSARFDPAGNQVNPTFGQFTSARNPRQMQLALRFYF